MTSSEIRAKFQEFFEERKHRIVRSSSLVPANDPTLLFANAGMNQFKDVFLGREKRDYSRACSSQKCVRAGGKHNDLEQVGRTRRHHTFFEMLGNFSFGDYFKQEAIAWAWELVTSPDWFAIPKDKLYATVFREDDEAEEIWAGIVPRDRIFRFDEKDNFWQMGETGPCGPCSELHYDMGPEASDLGHKECKFPCPQDCGRYVEIWNLVFMQFNRYCATERAKGSHTVEEFEAAKKASEQAHRLITVHEYLGCKLLDEPLPKPSVDTGAGLERMASVLQGKLSNFDTDLFRPLIEEAAGLANKQYGENHDTDVSLRIIADHARAATFLISDGVLPSNEGRGYVLRLIMRRALYHGQTLGLNEPFLFKMSRHVVDMMKDAYPELVETSHHIAKAIKIEEDKFEIIRRLGLDRIWDIDLLYGDGTEKIQARDWKSADAKFRTFAKAKTEAAQKAGKTPPLPPNTAVWMSGEDLFRLHDTFGQRPDFVKDILSTIEGTSTDESGYQREMDRQRERARASWKGSPKKSIEIPFENLPATQFEGYERTESEGSMVRGIFRIGQGALRELLPGEEAEVILDRTPFYAESGGQIGDTGWLYDTDHGTVLAEVQDCIKVLNEHLHKVRARQRLQMGDLVNAVVDSERRDAIRRAHTATHLLHAALRETLGTHVKQAGSLVAPDGLRFDFTHFAKTTDQDILEIEDLVNRHVLKNEEVITSIMGRDAAVDSGAMALFGEKYADQVRVLTINDFSKELCGGTHVRQTGDIGLFKVTYEASVAAGTRRIEATTGLSSLKYFRRLNEDIRQLADSLRAKPEELVDAAEKLAQSEKHLRKQIEAQQMKRAASEAGDLAGEAKDVKGVRVVAAKVDVTDRGAMRQMVDSLRPKLGSGVIVLGSAADGKAAIIVGVTKDLTAKLDAGKIVREAAKLIEGSGGGRKDLAEAGGKNPGRLDEAIAAVPGIIEKML